MVGGGKGWKVTSELARLCVLDDGCSFLLPDSLFALSFYLIIWISLSLTRERSHLWLALLVYCVACDKWGKIMTDLVQQAKNDVSNQKQKSILIWR